MATSEERLKELGFGVPASEQKQEEPGLFDSVGNWFSSLWEDEKQADAARYQAELMQPGTSAARLAELGFGAQDQAIQQPEDVSAFEDVAKGVASGLLAIPQGLGETFGSIVDVIFDTDTTKNVTEKFGQIREDLGIDPQGTAGEIAEVLIQFGLPGLGAASAVSKFSKAAQLAKAGPMTQLSKTAKAVRTVSVEANLPKITYRLQQMGAAGLADAVVATDGVTTLGDFFEGGPTQTDESIGLQGREEALRRIKNKLSLGAESTVLAGAVPVALKGLGVAGTGAAKGVAAVTGDIKLGDKTIPGLATTAKKILDKTGGYFDESQIAASSFRRKLNDNLFQYLRARGNLPEEAFNIRTLSEGQVASEMQRVDVNLRSLQRIMDANLRPKLWKASRSTDDKLLVKQVYNKIEAALAGETDELVAGGAKVSVRENLSDFIKTELKNAGYKADMSWADDVSTMVDEARKHIDDLSGRFKDFPELKDVFESTIRENMGSYLTRVYRLHTDKNWVNFVYNTKEGKKLISDTKGWLNQELASKAGKTLDDSELDQIIADILNPRAGKAPTKFGPGVDKTALDSLRSRGILQNRQNVPEVIRKLMGEIDDPRSHYAYTISKMSRYLADRQFYKGLVDDGLEKGYIYRNFEDIPLEKRGLFTGEAVSIDKAKYGDIAGMYVRDDVFKALDKTSKLYNQDRGMFYSIYASTYLPLKGVSQYSKTVLSPITQIRNLTTASFFAMAQGNVGRGANVLRSAKTVMKNIQRMAPEDQLNHYRKLQELGVINTSVQVEEMRRLIDDELALGDPALSGLARVLGRDFTSTKVGKIGRVNDMLLNRVRNIPGMNLARDIYQGSDDIWKMYNWEFEKNKLMGAFAKDIASGKVTKEAAEQLAEKKAAEIVRNTVPNYAAVPELIREARKLPVGNFISFPAEIFRTGYNTLKYAIDELASDNAAIREIGARRLMGISSVAAGVPTMMQYAAEQATGITEEQMDAVKAHLSAPWQKNSILIPTGRKANGEITYLDFSYMNPYDMLQRPIQGAMNAWTEGTIKDQDLPEKLFRFGIGGISEMVKPFIDPSIMTEKINGALTGRTQDGRKVWREIDSLGDKMSKSFFYMLDGVMPPVLPLDVRGAPETIARGSAVEAGRLTKAFLGAISDDPRAKVDVRGNQRKLEAEILRAFTGITEYETDVNKSLKYGGFEHGQNLADATNAFTSSLTRGGYFTNEEAETAFRTANEMRYRSFSNLYQKIQAAKVVGKNEREIYDALKSAKVGDVDSLLRGEFVPYFPGEESIRRIESMPENQGIKNRVPTRLLDRVYREYDRKRLLTEPVDQDLGPLSLGPMFEEPVAQAAPAPQPRAAAPQQQSVTAPIPQTGGITAAPQQLPRTPATLAALGLGPMDQLIAERQAMQQQPQGFAGGGPVKSGLKILGRSAAQVARRKQIRDQIDPIKARMSELDEIIKDPSKGTARGAARLERNKLESELKPLQKQLTDLYLDKD